MSDWYNYQGGQPYTNGPSGHQVQGQGQAGSGSGHPASAYPSGYGYPSGSSASSVTSVYPPMMPGQGYAANQAGGMMGNNNNSSSSNSHYIEDDQVSWKSAFGVGTLAGEPPLFEGKSERMRESFLI